MAEYRFLKSLGFKEWREDFQGHKIRVTNTWFGGAKLFIDDKCCDVNTDKVVWSIKKALLRARIDPGNPDSPVVEVFAKPNVVFPLGICVNGKLLASEVVEKNWSNVVVKAVGLAALPLVYLPFSQYAATSSWGSQMFVELGIIFILPMFVVVPVLLLAPILWLFRKTRRAALVALVFAVTYLLAMVVAVNSGHWIRMKGFSRLANRTKPLVAAIRGYEAKYGHPPEKLSILVPDFIRAIPTTQMRAYPRFEYIVGEKAKDFDNNPWVLTVFTPSGGINFDQFIYLPRQNYPNRGYGGYIERLGDWAYVHE